MLTGSQAHRSARRKRSDVAASKACSDQRFFACLADAAKNSLRGRRTARSVPLGDTWQVVDAGPAVQWLCCSSCSTHRRARRPTTLRERVVRRQSACPIWAIADEDLYVTCKKKSSNFFCSTRQAAPPRDRSDDVPNTPAVCSSRRIIALLRERFSRADGTLPCAIRTCPSAMPQAELSGLPAAAHAFRSRPDSRTRLADLFLRPASCDLACLIPSVFDYLRAD